MNTSSKTDPTDPIAFTAAPESRQLLQQTLIERQQQLLQAEGHISPTGRAHLYLEMAEIMLEIGDSGMPEAAWGLGRDAFKFYSEAEQWQDAVQCCDLLFRTGLDNAVIALGNGLWLAVAYPIDPQISLLMLNHLIEATPANADGAAVAAASAHYIADLRLQGEARENLMFLTSTLLSKVAERHSQVSSQQAMDIWLQRLELLDPKVFLPRLGQVIDAIVDGQWWYDRELLRSRLPVH